jgi:glutamate-ammonia-ligase adenylyltransferase
MRMRLEKDRATSNPWHIKYIRGGLVDAEFISQFLQLRWAGEHPEALATNTFRAFSRLAAVQAMDAGLAEKLATATQLLSALQGVLRLCTQETLDEEQAPDGLRRALVRAGKAADFEELRSRLVSAERDILDAYRTLIGKPADEIRQKNH